MPVPEHLLIHTVTVVEPASVTDAYNNATPDYDAGTRTDVSAWLQQDVRSETFADGRDPLDQRWLMITNHSPISGAARIEWADAPGGTMTFDVDGPTEPTYTPAGFHHSELTLRVTSG